MRTQLTAWALTLSASSLCHALPGYPPVHTPPTIPHPYWGEGPYSMNKTVYGSATSFPLPTLPAEELCETATTTPYPSEPFETNTTIQPHPSIIYQPSTRLPAYPTPPTWASGYPTPWNSTTLVTPLPSGTYPVLSSPSPSPCNTTDIPPAFPLPPSTASPSPATSVPVSSSVFVPTFTLETSFITTTATATTITTATVITAQPNASSTSSDDSTSAASESYSAEPSTIDSTSALSTPSAAASTAEPANPTAVGTTEQFTLTKTATPTMSSSSTTEPTGAPPAPPVFVSGGMGKEKVWWVSFVIPFLFMM